ncbi:hypothetical protein BDZ97DRAFT_1825731, partial [Flammula alnicola]
CTIWVYNEPIFLLPFVCVVFFFGTSGTYLCAYSTFQLFSTPGNRYSLRSSWILLFQAETCKILSHELDAQIILWAPLMGWTRLYSSQM